MGANKISQYLRAPRRRGAASRPRVRGCRGGRGGNGVEEEEEEGGQDRGRGRGSAALI